MTIDSERRMERAAWITLIVCVILLAYSVGLSVYRFSVPTDGWTTRDVDPGSPAGLIFVTNVTGVESGLQPEDVLTAVEGIPYAEVPFEGVDHPAGSVSYTVQRGDQELTLDVPLTHWDAGKLWRDYGRAQYLFAILWLIPLIAVSSFTFFMRPGSKAARVLLLFSVLMILSSFEYPPIGTGGLLDGGVNIGGTVLILLLYSVLMPPTLLRFTLVFPHPKQIIARHPWLEYAPHLVGLVVIPAFLAGYFIVGWIWTLAAILGSIISLIHSYITQRDAISRAQLRWAIGGLVVGLSLTTLSFPVSFNMVADSTTTILNFLVNASNTVIGVTLAIAILRYRLFDIDLIIRRTLTYALVTALLAMTYFGGVVLLQSLFEGVAGERSPLAIVASTLLIAALFTPLRRRVQGFVDRRFNRSSYDTEQTLEQFGAVTRSEVGLENLETALLSVVDETMQPAQVSLWVNEPPRQQKPDYSR